MRSCHRRCRTRNPRNQPLLTFTDALIAGYGSGGTVKTCPPKPEVQIKKEQDMPRNSADSLRDPEYRAALVKNPILARQLTDALSAIDAWQVN